MADIPGEEAAADAARSANLAAYIPALLAAALFAGLATFLPAVAAGEVLRYGVDWVPSLGLRAGVVIDGLSLTFGLLITGIGALVMLYSARYLEGHVHYARFASYLTVFMLAMLGLVLADNLLFLFVFWEATTIASYLLIGFGHGQAKSRRAALQALLVTGTGGLALLAGIILLGSVVGSFDLAVVLASRDVLQAHPLHL